MKGTQVFQKLWPALFLTMAIFPNSSLAANNQWQGSIPNIASAPAPWFTLIESMQQNNMQFGIAAAARRMLTFFPDISTKDSTYRIAVKLIDEGFPIPLRDLFIPGDIEPASPTEHGEDYNFANAYYLYKAILAQNKGINRWATDFFARIDRDNFPKYLFYKALDAYEKSDLPSAVTLLQQTLTKSIGEQPEGFITNVVRTLARVYFEQGEYEKSLDIYVNYLNKLNPITPADWLETGWCYFHLKRYDEAIGILYNLESKSAERKLINLEKFNIRALIYRQTCSIPQMEELIQTFDRTYGKTIDKIKRGEALLALPILNTIEIPENLEYDQLQLTLTKLQGEWARMGDLPKGSRSLAQYLYKTEVQMLSQNIKGLTLKAYAQAGGQLIMLAEQMKFLKFDIERSKFNPDNVFKPEDETKPKSTAPVVDPVFELKWMQFGDYWYDERSNYKGILPNRCTE